MKKTKEEIRELARFVSHYYELRNIVCKLHRLDENACNFGLTSSQEKNESKLEERAKEIASNLGMAIYHQGDPRGWPLYLVPDDNENHEVDYCDYIAIDPFIGGS